MGRITGLPVIPPKTETSLKTALEKMRELIEVGEGDRGDPLDRKLTVRDLLDLGLAELLSKNAGRIVSGSNFVATVGSDTRPITPVAPTGLIVSGGFSHILLEWDQPDYLYNGHGKTSILRNTVDNLANAVVVGETGGFIYADLNVTSGTTYYYWIYFTSESDTKGAANSPTGTAGQTAIDPALVLASLSNQITSTQLYADLNARIDLIDFPSTGLVAKASATELALQSLQDQVDGLVVGSDIDIYYQPTAPADPIVEGSRWFDTDDNNHPYVYVDLTWNDARDNLSTLNTTNLIAETAARVAADGVITTSVTALESTVYNPTTGVAANNTAVSALTGQVTTLSGVVTSHTSSITSLQSTVFDATNGVGAHTTAINGLTTRVTAAEGVNTSQAGSITALQTTVNHPTTGVSATAGAVSGITARIDTGTGNLLTTESVLFTQLQTTAGQNQAAVAIHGSSLNGLEASYSVKVDVNGRVAGYGLASTTNTYNGTIHSTMLFSVDTFAVGAPAATSLTFVIEGGRVVMNGADIQDATIGTLQVSSIAVDKITGINATFLQANIGTAWITSAHIQNSLESTSYTPSGGTQGWKIHRDGTSFFNNIYARGNIEATSIKAGSAEIIDTLMLKGSTVFLGDGGKIVADRSIPSEAGGSATITHGTINFDFTGAKSNQPIIFNNLTVDYVINAGFSGFPPSSTFSFTFWVEVYRGASLLMSRSVGGNQNYVNPFTVHSIVLPTFVDRPPAGAVIYTVKVRAFYTGSMSLNARDIYWSLTAGKA